MKTYRTLKKPTAGGTTKTVLSKQKPKRASCGMTGEKLPGVKAQNQSKNRNTAKSKKRPNRKFGGAYSSKAARAIIRQEVRNNA